MLRLERLGNLIGSRLTRNALGGNFAWSSVRHGKPPKHIQGKNSKPRRPKSWIKNLTFLLVKTGKGKRLNDENETKQENDGWMLVGQILLAEWIMEVKRCIEIL